ncbi:MAG: TetR family transcriptional regulator [Chroococcales cyanobacterium metabat2.561]|nr:MAG: TetR family transcriptional regulator [Chroococcales cyanobacterium metabat2.561]
MNAKQIKFIHDNYDKMTAPEISREIGMSREMIYYYFKKNGLPLFSKAPPKLTNEQKDLILSYFYQECDNRTSVIARITGINKATIDSFLDRHLLEKEKRLKRRSFEEIDWDKL